jgi:hypothetical protein
MEKTYQNYTKHSSVKHVMVVKSSFLDSLLMSSFPAAFASLSSAYKVYMKGASPFSSGSADDQT